MIFMVQGMAEFFYLAKYDCRIRPRLGYVPVVWKDAAHAVKQSLIERYNIECSENILCSLWFYRWFSSRWRWELRRFFASRTTNAGRLHLFSSASPPPTLVSLHPPTTWPHRVCPPSFSERYNLRQHTTQPVIVLNFFAFLLQSNYSHPFSSVCNIKFSDCIFAARCGLGFARVDVFDGFCNSAVQRRCDRDRSIVCLRLDLIRILRDVEHNQSRSSQRSDLVVIIYSPTDIHLSN